MKTKITILVLGAILTMLSPLRTNAGFFEYDSLAPESEYVDSITESFMTEDEPPEDSFPTQEQYKEMEKRGDTTFITLGNKRIKIIEENGETEVKIINKDEPDEDLDISEFDSEEDFDEDYDSWKDFKGHWAGFEFGLNNYVNSDFSISRTPETEFLDLNTSKSWNFNLNFAQYSAGFGTDQFGIVTGMGFEWCNYHFNDSSIREADGEIIARDIPESTTKNRLQTTYLTIPLLLEIQFPGGDRDERIFINAGVIGGIKLFSNTKIKYVEDGIDRKEKLRNDYYLSPLRYGFTARVGYKALKLYMNYYPTPFFMKDRGPELYPVAVGLAIGF